jgi:hypothetical protein
MSLAVAQRPVHMVVTRPLITVVVRSLTLVPQLSSIFEIIQ